MITSYERRPPIFPMIFWALVLMGFGYLFSCGTRLYDVPTEALALAPTEKLAAHPVVPTDEAFSTARAKIDGGQWTQLLAEPPFVPPEHSGDEISQSHQYRKWNYWMMSQRAGTLSYLTFSAGFSLSVFAVFYVLCDILGCQLGVFRTFGSNALVAYVLHMMVASAVKPFMPRDVPQWYMWAGCALFMFVTYLIVRTLEKNEIYVKL